MSDRDDPERLLTSGGTLLEQRLIGAIAREHPSPDLRERMAQAIGVSVGAAAAAGTATKAGVVARKAAAGAGSGSTSLVAWLSVGIVGLTVAGAVVGAKWQRKSPSGAAPASLQAVPPMEAPAVLAPSPEIAVPVPAPARSATASASERRLQSRPAASDLRDQISLIDAARAAVSTSAAARALEIVRRYQDRYPLGTFRPEAAALRIEALGQLGRLSEARALAERFLAEYGESPQTNRVLQAAGLPRPRPLHGR